MQMTSVHSGPGALNSLSVTSLSAACLSVQLPVCLFFLSLRACLSLCLMEYPYIIDDETFV